MRQTKTTFAPIRPYRIAKLTNRRYVPQARGLGFDWGSVFDFARDILKPAPSASLYVPQFQTEQAALSKQLESVRALANAGELTEGTLSAAKDAVRNIVQRFQTYALSVGTKAARDAAAALEQNALAVQAEMEKAAEGQAAGTGAGGGSLLPWILGGVVLLAVVRKI